MVVPPPAARWPWPLNTGIKVANAWWTLAWEEYATVRWLESMSGTVLISPVFSGPALAAGALGAGAATWRVLRHGG
eukprot:8338828-Alexandrium_andersonii.AAC.1